MVINVDHRRQQERRDNNSIVSFPFIRLWLDQNNEEKVSHSRKEIRDDGPVGTFFLLFIDVLRPDLSLLTV